MRIKNKERVRAIGKLIGIYREEMRHNSQNEYTLTRFCDGICTINTLKRIESGECSRSDEVYDELLKKFDLRFNYFPEVDEAVEMMMDPLYEAIEYFDLDKIEKTCKKMLNLLEKVKSYVYYSELYLLVENTRTYYKDDIEINKTISERYEKLLEILSNKFECLLKQQILARASIDAIDNPNTYNQIVNKMRVSECNSAPMQFFVLKYYLTTSQYISLINLINKLEIYFEERNNYTRLIDVYNYAFVSYSSIEKMKRTEYLDKIDKLVNLAKVPNYKISETYSNIACTLHTEKNYTESLNYFKKVMKFKDVPHITETIIMANCQSHLDLPIDIPTIPQEMLSKYSTYLQYMYNFYVINDVPSTIKQKIIIKNIAPYLYDPDLIEIFRFELKKTFTDQNNYSNLYMFDNIVEKNLNK